MVPQGITSSPQQFSQPVPLSSTYPSGTVTSSSGIPKTLADARNQFISIEAASADKESFILFVKKAVESADTREYKELYRFLLDCFTEADTDFDGRVGPSDFDMLVERAGSLPRKFGFAPTSAEMYATPAQRQEGRQAMFKAMNTSGSGFIAFDEWLTFSIEHISQKATLLDVDDSKSKMEKSPEDFKQFVIAACRSQTSAEYKELYHFLLACFTEADSDHDGRVGPKEFDAMIEIAAAAPRRFGFAPPSNQMFASAAERMAAREKMFAEMDVDKSGFIAFDEWLEFCYVHIQGKAQILDEASAGQFVNIESASNDKEAFVRFILRATQDKSTDEYKELYRFLLSCFTEADSNFDGKVGPVEFDIMVERAAAMPRKFGFAPSSAEMFKSASARTQARESMFQKMNTSGSGVIAFDEWLNFCYDHIVGKAAGLNISQAKSRMDTNRGDFANFIKAATHSKISPEYKELYRFLLKCFTEADSDNDGRVGPKEFDTMIEIAAAAPRRFGFAPPSVQTYRNMQERCAAREKMFLEMDTDKSNYIAFDEWLIFCYEHIVGKAKTL